MAENKDYEVVRYFSTGLRPERIKENLTLDQALAHCKLSNDTMVKDQPIRGWVDVAQRKGLFE